MSDVHAAAIDTHHHMVPPDYAAWLSAAGRGRRPADPGLEPMRRSRSMDRHGVRTAVLSVSTPGVHLGDGRRRARGAQVNEYAADVVNRIPGPLRLLRHADAARRRRLARELALRLRQLRRGRRRPAREHARRVPRRRAFESAVRRAESPQAVVFVHPSQPPGLGPLPGIPPFVADFLLDTTRAAIRLAGAGTLDRCPDMKRDPVARGRLRALRRASLRVRAHRRRDDTRDGIAHLESSTSTSRSRAARPRCRVCSPSRRPVTSLRQRLAVRARRRLAGSPACTRSSKSRPSSAHRSTAARPRLSSRACSPTMGHGMKLANVNGRAALVLGDEVADVAAASDRGFRARRRGLRRLGGVRVVRRDRHAGTGPLVETTRLPRARTAAGVRHRAQLPEPRRRVGEGPPRRCPPRSPSSREPRSAPSTNVIVGSTRRLGGRAGRGDRAESRPDGGRADAWSHVAGLTVGQDLSDRSPPVRRPDPVLPREVTPRVRPDGALGRHPRRGRATPTIWRSGARWTGRSVQDARTKDLVFGVPRLVAELSSVLPLLPGDVIFTGTPAGVGHRALACRGRSGRGKVLETWVEGIGTIRNRVV